MDPQELHRDALVIDGLVYHCDGWTGDLRAGGGDALNVTAFHFEADFPEACAQIAQWHGILGAPDSEWRLIERAADFDRARAEGRIGLIMGWQNTRPIADRLDRLHFFHRLGLRIMQLTYNYRNFLGDGCLEPEGAGLSSLGRDAVRLMNQLGIAIDLSHVGYRTAMDAIELSAAPVLATHANAKAVTDLARNKPDDLIRAVAEKGGLIGASIYGPMCWDGDERRNQQDQAEPGIMAGQCVGQRGLAADFDGGVQERGLYFPATWDERYVPLLGMADPGEKESKGALLAARHGKGTYVYTGLSFFRQLPAGVPGAIRLFANLVSGGRNGG